jgi:hypothetical protein
LGAILKKVGWDRVSKEEYPKAALANNGKDQKTRTRRRAVFLANPRASEDN